MCARECVSVHTLSLIALIHEQSQCCLHLLPLLLLVFIYSLRRWMSYFVPYARTCVWARACAFMYNSNVYTYNDDVSVGLFQGLIHWGGI